MMDRINCCVDIDAAIAGVAFHLNSNTENAGNPNSAAFILHSHECQCRRCAKMRYMLSSHDVNVGESESLKTLEMNGQSVVTEFESDHISVQFCVAGLMS